MTRAAGSLENAYGLGDVVSYVNNLIHEYAGGSLQINGDLLTGVFDGVYGSIERLAGR